MRKSKRNTEVEFATSTMGGVETPKKPIYKRKWFWVIVVLALIIGGCSAGGEDEEVTAPAPNETVEEAKPIEETKKEEPKKNVKDEATIRKEECVGTYYIYCVTLDGIDFTPEELSAMDTGFDLSCDSLILENNNVTLTLYGTTMNFGDYTIDEYYNIIPNKLGKNSLTNGEDSITLEGVDPTTGEAVVSQSTGDLYATYYFRRG